MKISVILFLMRIFPQSSQSMHFRSYTWLSGRKLPNTRPVTNHSLGLGKFHVACKVVIAFLVAFTISGTLVVAFQCKPARYTHVFYSSRERIANHKRGIELLTSPAFLVQNVSRLTHFLAYSCSRESQCSLRMLLLSLCQCRSFGSWICPLRNESP